MLKRQIRHTCGRMLLSRAGLVKSQAATNFPAGNRRAAVRTYHCHGLDIAVISAEHGGNLDHRLHGATIKQAVFDGFVSRNKARP